MSQVTEGQLRDIISLKAHRDPAFRKQLITSPKTTVEGILGTSLGANVSVAVVEDTDNKITMVIPPAATDELSEDQLEARLAETTQDIDDPARRKFLNERVERLETWMRSGGRVLPVLQKLLGQ